MSEAIESSIRVISFNGKKTEWEAFEERFLAKAARKGYKAVLLGEIPVHKKDEMIDETEDGKKKKRAKEMNEIAYTELILSMDPKKSAGKVAFKLVKGTKTEEFPDGNAKIAWERLIKKYRPSSAPTMVNLEKTFRQSKLGKGQDPDNWITYLEDIRTRLESMGSIITENQLLIHILNNLTSDYEMQVLLMEKRVGDKTNPLTLEELRDELNLKYERMNRKKREEDVDTEEEEQAMIANSGQGKSKERKSGQSAHKADKEQWCMVTMQSKRKCYNCGKYGHIGVNCPERQSRQGGQGRGFHHGGQGDGRGRFGGRGRKICNYCKKGGHIEANCWKKQEDQANAVMGEETEFDMVMTCMDVHEYPLECIFNDKLSVEEVTEGMNEIYEVSNNYKHPYNVKHNDSLNITNMVADSFNTHTKSSIQDESILSNLNDCATKKENENILMVTTEDQVPINETSLLSKENDQQIGNNTWLGDTGASTHYVKSDEGMFDVKLIDEPVKVGNGKSMRATKVGSLKMTVLQANGDTKNITLENVKYVPELWVNLFSITQALKKGMKIANDGIKIQLRKGDFMMEFDLIIATKTGYIIAVNMVPRIENHVAQAALDPGHRISLNKAHRLLGHIGEDAMRTTAKVYGWFFVWKTCQM